MWIWVRDSFMCEIWVRDSFMCEMWAPCLIRSLWCAWSKDHFGATYLDMSSWLMYVWDMSLWLIHSLWCARSTDHLLYLLYDRADDSSILVWHDSFTCVTWHYMRDMTPSHVWHDSITCVTWLLHMCDMTRSCSIWSNRADDSSIHRGTYHIPEST